MKKQIDVTKPLETLIGQNVEVYNTTRGILIGFIEGYDGLFSWNSMGELLNGTHLSTGNIVNIPDPPKWRPYRDGEVKLRDQFKHREKKMLIIMVIALDEGKIYAAHSEMNYEELFANWLKLDGTPAGVLVEEKQ
jgi:hypothetical protein